MFKEILYSNYPSRSKKIKKITNFFPLFWVLFDLAMISGLGGLYELKGLVDYLNTISISFISLIPILLWCVLFRIYTHYDNQITKHEKKYQKEFYSKYISNFDNYVSYCRICGKELSAKYFYTSSGFYIKPIKIGPSDYKNYYCKSCFKKFSLPQIYYAIIVNLVSIIPVILFFTFIFNKMNGINSFIGLINILIGFAILIIFLIFGIFHYIQGLSIYLN